MVYGFRVKFGFTVVGFCFRVWGDVGASLDCIGLGVCRDCGVYTQGHVCISVLGVLWLVAKGL